MTTASTQATSSRTTSATYDDQDRLLSYGSSTYSSNDDGDLVTRTTNSFVETFDYDVFGNLVTYSSPSIDVEYVVDGQNRRVGKKINGTLIQGFLYAERLNPVAELDGSGNTISTFVYGTRPTTPDYMVKGGVTYRVLSDHLGSVRLVVNATDGTLAQRMDYDAWGNVVYDSSPGFQPFGFAGGIYDRHTGLTRFGARDYDPTTGRWTAKDPILFAGGDTNLYRYAAGDPVNLVDVAGLDGNAAICKRPLKGKEWVPGFSDGSSILDDMNLEYAHEGIVFPDGTTRGFGSTTGLPVGPGDEAEDGEETKGTYMTCDAQIYDADLLTEAADSVGVPDTYLLVGGSNCQDWASQVRREYRRLNGEEVIEYVLPKGYVDFKGD